MKKGIRQSGFLSNNELINPNINHFSNTPLPVQPYLASEAVKDHHMRSIRLYNNLIEKGVCREQARGVLPQNLYTQYYGTTDLHNLLKFVSLRVHEGAQWEIQRTAEACLEVAMDLFPITVSSLILDFCLTNPIKATEPTPKTKAPKEKGRPKA